ncbi:LysM peptidoglycan-binding domain-containing protein [Lysobacter sp. H21R4]|uniref:LysM peptidoglycan-binding domain-containing protein n=1 Tax=Lysobacter sp. H21R4 TaxID=2781021 RepID=UPI0018876BD5|nr:LysM peptidoglycan-binding domain-containing protein [Lysobacter sp. H21R4]QOY62736.1 LysM peptidoglycan-binding domain-containing protein [Lysobacter sp. H21R4]
MSHPDRKADFSGVTSRVDTTADKTHTADFSAVSSRVDTTAQKTGQASSELYTVKPGDTLSHIAKHFYGKASAWNTIYDANRDQLDNPDRIQPGQVLRVPARDDR